MKYSIDTSALLDGWVRFYPPDIFPTLWERIDSLIASEVLKATEEVYFELSKKDDDVYAWAKERLDMFVLLDQPIQLQVTKILATYDGLLGNSASRSGADAFVIALAQLSNCTVVTGENASGKLNKPRIPDICLSLGIPCIKLVDLFRIEGWRL